MKSWTLQLNAAFSVCRGGLGPFLFAFVDTSCTTVLLLRTGGGAEIRELRWRGLETFPQKSHSNKDRLWV